MDTQLLPPCSINDLLSINTPQVDGLFRLFTEEEHEKKAAFSSFRPYKFCVLPTEITAQVKSNIHGKSASSLLSSIDGTNFDDKEIQ